MKVLFGICGLGNGHSIRQHVLIDRFLLAGHRIALFTNKSSTAYFNNAMPAINRFEVWNPRIPANSAGLSFSEIAQHPDNQAPAAIQISFGSMNALMELFNGPPDLIISDYEPVSAQFAYATGTPLVTIDNQSLCLGYQLPELPPFGPREETGRLRMFFPQARLRIALSLIPGDHWARNEQFCVATVPPIVRQRIYDLIRDNAVRNHFVVYVSPYEALPQNIQELADVLNKCPEYTFAMFSDYIRFNTVIGNVTLAPFCLERFESQLSKASGLIATAGFTLLSEAMHLKLPFYAIPFNTYEQHLNCRMIELLGIGCWSREVSPSSIHSFAERISEYESRFCDVGADHSHISKSGLSIIWRLLANEFPGRFAATG
jgi:uncharacterized protein (TIGR00661 family)